jgi:hypothetical protein
MNKEEAIQLLSFHSGRNPSIDDPKWCNGFLGSLRPYKGGLNEHNFIEVMECLKALASEFNGNVVDKDLMADIYGIFYYTNLWTGRNGMLVNVLPEDAQKKLDTWMKIYSYAVSSLLDYSENKLEEAFYEYEDYLQGITNYD